MKVGFGLKSDRGSLLRSLGIKVGALVELTETLRALRYKHALGAKAAVAIVLGQRLQKLEVGHDFQLGFSHPEAEPASVRSE